MREKAMSADENIQAVQAIYEAFGAGDVDTIVAACTDDVDWSAEAAGTVAPWHGPHKGKAEVPLFFSALADTVEVTEFTPLAFGAADDDVLVVIRFGMRAKTTGKSATMELHHWWHFRDGKVARYRGTEDTALTAEILAAR
jgi:ketosteroid isomerase-like protein